MTWTYSQSTGRLTRDGRSVGAGYSGAGLGRNNGALQGTPNIGPIPTGAYTIGGAYDTASHGPHVMRLTPRGHSALGRSGFLMHGDNPRHDASEGCVIMSRAIRDQVSRSGDTVLEVVP